MSLHWQLLDLRSLLSTCSVYLISAADHSSIKCRHHPTAPLMSAVPAPMRWTEMGRGCQCVQHQWMQPSETAKSCLTGTDVNWITMGFCQPSLLLVLSVSVSLTNISTVTPVRTFGNYCNMVFAHCMTNEQCQRTEKINMQTVTNSICHELSLQNTPAVPSKHHIIHWTRPTIFLIRNLY